MELNAQRRISRYVLVHRDSSLEVYHLVTYVIIPHHVRDAHRTHLPSARCRDARLPQGVRFAQTGCTPRRGGPLGSHGRFCPGNGAPHAVTSPRVLLAIGKTQYADPKTCFESCVLTFDASDQYKNSLIAKIAARVCLERLVAAVRISNKRRPRPVNFTRPLMTH